MRFSLANCGFLLICLSSISGSAHACESYKGGMNDGLKAAYQSFAELVSSGELILSTQQILEEGKRKWCSTAAIRFRRYADTDACHIAFRCDLNGETVNSAGTNSPSWKIFGVVLGLIPLALL